MAAGYVDDHRLVLYRDGAQPRDITAYAGDMTLTDELATLAAELSFTVLESPWDKYVPKINLVPGDKLRVTNHGNTVFSGIVVAVTLDGAVTAYDRGWYLGKSEIVLQVTGLAADQVIRRACAKAGVGVGSVCSLPTLITQCWTGSTPADIIDEVLDSCEAATGRQYRRRVDDTGLVVEALPVSAIKAMHRPAENLPGFDITWALGQVSGEDSIADTYNAVVIAAEDDGKAYIGAQASNAASVKRYGFLQHVETVTENPGTAVLGAMVRNLLQNADRVGRTRTISEIWGCDEVKSGVVLNFSSTAFGIEGKHRVTRVRHHYGGTGHTMELEISALEQPRAAAEGKTDAASVRAAASDKVSVYGLPESISSGDGSGTTVKALFTAYYPANNAMEGGYVDAQGNKLDPAKKTCAAPPSVPFGTKITVQGTGTSRDGETYTVTDRGGAIQIDGETYHFDLLMGSAAECNSWGRKYGTALIGGAGASGGVAAFVNVALGEVGYRESAGNRTKYGAAMGCDGVAWCVIFVCWCAKQSGAPIPTGYSYVGDMTDYYKARGKYHAASGYTPKAGDLMIQGDRHIGIVLSASGSRVETVEGNVSDSVKRMVRDKSEITGFCSPW